MAKIRDQNESPDGRPLSSDKAALRRLMETRRATAFAQNPQAPVMLREAFLKTILLPPGSIVASYSARGTEMNPEPLTDALRATGHRIALPIMTGRDRPLVFRLHDQGAPLVRNAFGIHEPKSAALLVEPDILLVPLLAFDHRCYRLGAGGGYYDRTIPELRQHKTVFAIGLGFSCQELPEIPIESHDVPLDKIVTELQVFSPFLP